MNEVTLTMTNKFYYQQILHINIYGRFLHSYVRASQYNSNYNQHHAMFLDSFISTDALHVSGGSSAHRQEQITVHMASGIVNQQADACS